MTPENFCYWLQGFVELHGVHPTHEQWLDIKEHLKLVFDKRTPDQKVQPEVGPYSPIPPFLPHKGSLIC